MTFYAKKEAARMVRYVPGTSQYSTYKNMFRPGKMGTKKQTYLILL